MKIEIIGNKKIHLILFHGWGIGKKIWHWIKLELSKYFTLHLFDMPGYGDNCNLYVHKIQDLIYMINQYIPQKCILIGWSMGGIITNHLALQYPKKIMAIINICSSPYFIKKNNWPGIEINFLKNMLNELKKNYRKTIINFLQYNVPNIMKDINNYNYIHNTLLKKPYPKPFILKKNLKIIKQSDLRNKIKKIKCPKLNIYGVLDKIVPIEIIYYLERKNTKSKIINHTAHLPFISQSKNFCTIIKKFISTLQNL
ncbi:alpha/beta fold hydrolase [Buchnera aphidicola]|uniref:alpha/beta fold hydrolase n=1 Tax=Buchnera aphidicola TaxID=9 RepID=UPI0031B888D2